MGKPFDALDAEHRSVCGVTARLAIGRQEMKSFMLSALNGSYNSNAPTFEFNTRYPLRDQVAGVAGNILQGAALPLRYYGKKSPLPSDTPVDLRFSMTAPVAANGSPEILSFQVQTTAGAIMLLQKKLEGASLAPDEAGRSDVRHLERYMLDHMSRMIEGRMPRETLGWFPEEGKKMREGHLCSMRESRHEQPRYSFAPNRGPGGGCRP